METDITTSFSMISKVRDYLGTTGWYMVLGEATALPGIADDLLDEADVRSIPSERATAFPSRTLVDRLNQGEAQLKVVVVNEVEAQEVAEVLESGRSRLPVARQIILVLTSRAAGAILARAGHFASFLAEVVEHRQATAPALNGEEAEARLAALRKLLGLTDAEVVRLASNRALPAGPEIAEWLVLLGRSDLV